MSSESRFLDWDGFVAMADEGESENFFRTNAHSFCRQNHQTLSSFLTTLTLQRLFKADFC